MFFFQRRACLPTRAKIHQRYTLQHLPLHSLTMQAYHSNLHFPALRRTRRNINLKYVYTHHSRWAALRTARERHTFFICRNLSNPNALHIVSKPDSDSQSCWWSCHVKVLESRHVIIWARSDVEIKLRLFFSSHVKSSSINISLARAFYPHIDAHTIVAISRNKLYVCFITRRTGRDGGAFGGRGVRGGERKINFINLFCK